MSASMKTIKGFFINSSSLLRETRRQLMHVCLVAKISVGDNYCRYYQNERPDKLLRSGSS
jgi:hypothetical protein